jgi:hypothetical protein
VGCYSLLSGLYLGQPSSIQSHCYSCLYPWRSAPWLRVSSTESLFQCLKDGLRFRNPWTVCFSVMCFVSFFAMLVTGNKPDRMCLMWFLFRL